MNRALNIAGLCCAAWCIIISINAGIYTISDIAAATLYLVSIFGMLIWVIAKVVITIHKITHAAPAWNEDKPAGEPAPEIGNDGQNK